MKNLLVLSIVTIIIGLIVFAGIWFYKDRYMSKDGVKITVYNRGNKIPIDPNAPYFRTLQEKGEEFLTSANNILKDFISKEKVLTIKKEELAIEITYLKPKEIEIPLFNRTVKGEHLLIPLTGKYVGMGEDVGAAIFFYGPESHTGPHKAPKDVTEIIKLLRLMEIEID